MLKKKKDAVGFSMALDVLCISDKQFNLMVAYKFSKAFLKITLYLLLNYNVNSGQIHKRRVSQIAKDTGVDSADVYAFKKVANKIGLANLHIKDMKLRGKIYHRAKQRFADDPDLIELVSVPKMRIAMIHSEGVKLLMANNATGSQMLIAISMAFHCDAKSGTLHEKHPDTYADMIGRHRTTVVRALAGLNEMGFLQTQTDFLVTGRIPYTALARGWFEQRRVAQARIDRGDAELKVKIDFMQAYRWLREGYGFCAEFLNNSSKVLAAAEALRSWASSAPEKPTQSVGYFLNKDGSKHWTDKGAFAKAVEAFGVSS